MASHQKFRSLRHLAEDLENIRRSWERAVPGADASPILTAGRLGALAVSYQDFYKRLLKNDGITLVEYWALGIMRADPNGVSSPSDLARLTRQTPAGMTKTLDRMERSGLVERTPHATDRRRTEVRITESGANMSERLFRAEIAGMQEAFAEIGEPALHRLYKSIDDALVRMEDHTIAASRRSSEASHPTGMPAKTTVSG